AVVEDRVARVGDVDVAGSRRVARAGAALGVEAALGAATAVDGLAAVGEGLGAQRGRRLAAAADVARGRRGDERQGDERDRAELAPADHGRTSRSTARPISALTIGYVAVATSRVP